MVKDTPLENMFRRLAVVVISVGLVACSPQTAVSDPNPTPPVAAERDPLQLALASLPEEELKVVETLPIEDTEEVWQLVTLRECTPLGEGADYVATLCPQDYAEIRLVGGSGGRMASYRMPYMGVASLQGPDLNGDVYCLHGGDGGINATYVCKAERDEPHRFSIRFFGTDTNSGRSIDPTWTVHESDFLVTYIDSDTPEGNLTMEIDEQGNPVLRLEGSPIQLDPETLEPLSS